MAKHHRQHFVPQFYFRLFSEGEPHICVFLPETEQIIPQAAVKGQCAKNELYGSSDIENLLSRLESEHATVLQAIVKADRNERIESIFQERFFCLLQAVMFQRARTILEIEKQTPALEAMALRAFSNHIRKRFSDSEFARFKLAIESGQVRLKESPTSSVLRQISIALEASYLLCDLEPRLLRNVTDLPFVFSDSPVVFYNMFLKNVIDRGVLGLQRPGLMIFYPLNTKLQLVLFDSKSYGGRILSEPIVDIFESADISNLNALQLHHCKSSVYFRSPTDGDYVRRLYRSHSPLIKKPTNEFRFRKDLLVNGDHSVKEGFQILEPQLNHELRLSFVECELVRNEDEHLFRHRDKRLVEEHKRCFPPRRRKRS